MVKQGSGHIVNTSSTGGFIPVPSQAAYGCTKHAIVGLSASLRVEAADLGVKVSVVCPGVVDTPHFDNALMIKVSKDDVMRSMPGFIRTDAEKAAIVILKGVKRNKPIIIISFYSRTAWLLNRISPAVMDIWARHHMKIFRKNRVSV
jgi:short-subunit dehydrogenase